MEHLTPASSLWPQWVITPTPLCWQSSRLDSVPVHFTLSKGWVLFRVQSMPQCSVYLLHFDIGVLIMTMDGLVLWLEKFWKHAFKCTWLRMKLWLYYVINNVDTFYQEDMNYNLHSGHVVTVFQEWCHRWLLTVPVTLLLGGLDACFPAAIYSVIVVSKFFRRPHYRCWFALVKGDM